jgi:hypothetical protein
MMRALLFCSLFVTGLTLAGQNTDPRGFYGGLQYRNDLRLNSGNLSQDGTFRLLFGYRFNDRWEAGLSPVITLGRVNRYDLDFHGRFYLGRPEQRFRAFLDAAFQWDGPFASDNPRSLAPALGGGVAYQIAPRFSLTYAMRYYRGFNNFRFDRIDREDGTFFLQVNRNENSSYGELRGTLTLRYHFGERNRNRPR